MGVVQCAWREDRPDAKNLSPKFNALWVMKMLQENQEYMNIC